MRDKGIHDTKPCSGKMRDCSGGDIEEQNRQKRIKFSKAESCKEVGSKICHKRKSVNKIIRNKKSSKDKSENMNEDEEACGETIVERDYMKDLKEEEEAHKSTKELVKTLKTKIRCLTSDYNELQTQLTEAEENMCKLKKESVKEIDFLKVCLAAKKEAELLSAKAASGRSTVKLVLEKDSTKCENLVTKEVAVQMDGNETGQSRVSNIEKKLAEPVKLELVEEVSVMVESVLAENTRVMQANADLINENSKLKHANIDLALKSDERKNAQKVFFEKFDQLKEEERDLRAKVLRVTIENMKLKTENHEARTKSSF